MPTIPIQTHRSNGLQLASAMKIGLRILLGYFLVVGLAAWFVLNVFVEEVKPGVNAKRWKIRWSTPRSLLAELVSDDMKARHTANIRHSRKRV
jgi:two-component system sensor histidine kinase CreC